MNHIIEQIRRYYERIDANDIEWVVSLFADNALYERAGSEFLGIAAIREFFAVHRQIRGVHHLKTIWAVEGGVVVVTGRFEGQGAQGDARSVGFADFWYFEANGLVSKRQSYLAMGHDYVRS